MTSFRNIFTWVLILSSIITLARGSGKIIEKEVSGYRLSIYLPNSYDSSNKHKVIYMNDGQWLFQRSGSMQLAVKLDSLIKNNAIEPIIVVGVHSDRSRTETYVPYKIEGNPYFDSKATVYADVLTKKIIPFIDSQYSTITNRDGRAIFGFSFGGLNATWLAIHYPSSFSFSAGFSPSYWVNDYQLLKEVRQSKEKTSFWFDIGTNEWNYYVPFIHTALQNGGIYGESVFYYEIPYGEHTIKDWEKRIAFPVLIFAGNKKAGIADWDIEIEVIKSQSRPGIFYQRINPIVTLSNGVKYSLADQAKYVLKNDSDGQLAADGRFVFKGTNDLQIMVSYKELKKEIRIKYQDIQRLRKQ